MKENQQIEWKESWRDEYMRWICGFANAEGGVQHIGRNPFRHFGVGFQVLPEVSPLRRAQLRPRLHRAGLDDAVGVVARESTFNKGQKYGLAVDQTERVDFQIFLSPLRVQDETLDQTGGFAQHVDG